MSNIEILLQILKIKLIKLYQQLIQINNQILLN
jgi:hypothetical protein